jgi:hypothetical protein
MSPVLQRRLEQNKAATATAPVFNLIISKDIIDVLRPQPQETVAEPLQPTLPTPMPVLHQALPLVPATNTPLYDFNCPTIIQDGHAPGPDMAIDMFCTQYQLGEGILKKLTDNSYTHARMFRFVTIQDLKEMHFRLGEVAGLRDAVDRWST